MNLTLEELITLMRQKTKKEKCDVVLRVTPNGSMEVLSVEFWGDSETKSIGKYCSTLPEFIEQNFKADIKWRDEP